MNKIRFTSLKASLVLAITFTISCEDKDAKTKPAETAAPPTEAANAENSDKPSAETPNAAAPKEGTFTDPRDGKKYKFVKIGEQVWMAENLNFAAKGSKCYENKPENCEKYGRLYDWETAKKSCPIGWRLPNDDEYDALYNSAGGRYDYKAEEKLKAKSGWENDRNGTDEFGFSALPGGLSNSDGDFFDVGYVGIWWSATEKSDSDYDYDRHMFCVITDEDREYGLNKSSLFSVRCLQD
jgi:uncharacterized protein (TIGR02145 family)